MDDYRKWDFPKTTGQLYVELQQSCQHVHHLHMLMPENSHGIEGEVGKKSHPLAEDLLEIDSCYKRKQQFPYGYDSL